ncbi:MAG: sigma-70 family RNA polymerase sigma factor [Carnobacterium sp.]|nr:sigma-70 family RNA polymerase sigma factor [Carnobacterium sp.]
MPVNDTGATIIDLTENGDTSVVNQVITKSQKLSEEISDENLYQAFSKLTDKQKEILEMIFIYGLSNKEIASYFGNSPQNISKLNKKALTDMKKELKKERKNNDEETT